MRAFSTLVLGLCIVLPLSAGNATINGTKDTLVGIEQAEKMLTKLREVGVSAELMPMEGDGHGWGGEKLTKTVDRSVRFFQERLGK